MKKDAVYLLTEKRAIPLKPMPPNFRNHGNYVISVAQLGRFLAEKAEEAGVYILTETAADKLLVEDRIVRGVRSGDKGRGRDGEPLANFEPGSDVVAKATVLAEGTLGHLSQAAIDYFGLFGARPAALGAGREGGLGGAEAARPRDPHDGLAAAQGARAGTSSAAASSTRWARTRSASGSSSGLDYTDATFSVHDVLQEFKTHPFVAGDPRGRQARRLGREDDSLGRLLRDAAARLAVPGMVIAGDAAGMVNIPS